MNKFLNILLIITTICISPLAFAIDIKPLYDCPSLMNYTPTMTQDKYCKSIQGFVDAGWMEKGKCSQYYNEQYGKVNSEYKQGKCKISSRKFVEGTFNSANCTIEFEERPFPQIMGHGSWNGNSTESMDGVKCIDNLYKGLKSIYPNIK